jgi:hypothetical protein
MRQLVVRSALALAVVAPVLAGGGAQAGVSSDHELAQGLLAAIDGAAFDEVVDFEFDAADGPAPQVANTPNVDVAVIALDGDGRPTAAANVLLSRDYPQGRVVSLDANLAAEGVDWRAWDIDRWDGDWDAPFPDGSQIVPGSSGDIFMSPYPASTFKLLIAVHTLRLVDEGVIDLDASFVYKRQKGDTCLGEKAKFRTTTAAELEKMITFSSNLATCALVKQLHRLDQVDAMNESFVDLGLPTLQVYGTDSGAGGTWNPGSIHMTAMDTARLLLIVNGSPGRLWTDPAGRPVTADGVLSAASRELLMGHLLDQGFNEVLSTTNWCGADYPDQGIPASVSETWIDPDDGTVTVDGIPYGRDVRPCNETAEVTFAHKNGLTYNYGSDAGIVKALPGEDGRQYIVAAFANLGYRYSDASQADSPDLPCFTSGVCYTEKFAILGKAVDDLMRTAS